MAAHAAAKSCCRCQSAPTSLPAQDHVSYQLSREAQAGDVMTRTACAFDGFTRLVAGALPRAAASGAAGRA